MPVSAVLAICFIVALIVARHISQGEAIVRRHEIDRRPRPPAILVELTGRAQKPCPEFLGAMTVTAPVTPHRVSKTIIPFGKFRRKFAKTVSAGANIPRLGNQSDIRQHRILAQGIEETAIAVKTMVFSGKGGGKIKAKPVNAHLQHPEAQTVHHHPQHLRVCHIQRVATSCIIDIVARLAGNQTVIGRIIKAAIAQGRTSVIAFRSVVVDHIQNDLDIMGVKFADHVAKAKKALRTVVARLGSKEADCVVAPVIAQTPVHQKPVIDERMNRQQFNGCHTKLLQMLQHGVRSQPFIGAFDSLGHRWMLLGKAFDMDLIDQCIVPVAIWTFFNSRKQFRVGYDGFGHHRSTVTLVE